MNLESHSIKKKMELMILQKREDIQNPGYFIIKTKQEKQFRRLWWSGSEKNPNIDIYEHHFAIEFLTQHHLGDVVKRNYPNIKCFGAYVADLKNQKVLTFLSRVTVVATGGLGNVYLTTTNPEIATGDGIAMVYRAKGTIENLEFIQFHPTSLYDPNTRPSFLITEALRGYGAVLKNMAG